MSYVAVIPARSGSKRIKNKNIKMLAGKPLMIWTIEACLRCKKITTVLLSTDSDEYVQVAKKYINNSKLLFDLRDASDASDKRKIFDYLLSKREKIFKELKQENFILALPTAPLRNTEHLDQAIEMFEVDNVPIFSATEYEFPISFAFKECLASGWEALFENSPMLNGNTRSQDNEKYFRPNGAIYVRKISDLVSGKINTLYDNAKPYIMKKIHSIDIDILDDFDMVEAILSKQA